MRMVSMSIIFINFFFYDVYLSRHMNCWGWGTWNDRWKFFEKNPEKILMTWPKNKIRSFDKNGLFNNWSQIKRNKKKIINTWAVFWNAKIFEKKGYCLNPTKSLVLNRGFDSSSTHMNIGDKKFQPKKVYNKKIIYYLKKKRQHYNYRPDNIDLFEI